MLTPLSRDTLTQQAADTLRRFIMNQGLRAGMKLPSERELSESLAISRNVVREALSHLVAEGLIEKKAGRGVFVREFDAVALVTVEATNLNSNGWNPADVSEARAVIELGAARLMAKRITPEQLQQLERLNSRMADNMRNNRSVIKEDIEFHKTLLQSTHNAVLIELFPLLVEYFRLAVVHDPSLILDNSDRVIDEHHQIIDALSTHDGAAVEAALLAHPLSFQRLEAPMLAYATTHFLP